METKNISGKYTLSQSIMIYTSKGAEQWNSRQYYLESHDINIDENGNPVLLEGKPLQKRTLIGLRNALAKQTTDQIQFKGIIPENLLYFDLRPSNTELVWFLPASKHQLYFTDRLHIPNGVANLPSLIFKMQNNHLLVFATKTKKKPNLDTKLYRAPFHNVGDSGSICLGSGKRQNKQTMYYDEEMASWERLFFATEFSATHGTPIKGNLNTLWKDLIKTGEKFPNNKLIESSYKTFGALTLKKR